MFKQDRTYCRVVHCLISTPASLIEVSLQPIRAGIAPADRETKTGRKKVLKIL